MKKLKHYVVTFARITTQKYKEKNYNIKAKDKKELI